jgi:predicted negative regulator of RcsB-dependent stress response
LKIGGSERLGASSEDEAVDDGSVGIIFRADADELRGRIALQRGDTAAAITAYRNFVEIWKQADPELQPRVTAARDALVRLGQ